MGKHRASARSRVGYGLAPDRSDWAALLRHASDQFKRRWVRRVALGLAGGALLAATIGWFTFQHKPGWYRPVAPSAATTRRAQADSAAVFDYISDHLVDGRSFDLSIRARSVTEWLAALPVLWPELQAELPPELCDFAVGFEEGAIRVGAHLERNGWKVIANLGVVVEVIANGDEIRVRLVDVRGGSLRLPRAAVERMLGGVEWARTSMTDGTGGASSSWQDAVRAVQTLDDAFRGVSLRNRFVWPNGRRPYRIAGVAATDGVLRLRIEPL